MSTDTVARLRRVRVAVRLTLTFGVLISVTANILHANPNPISQAIAAWAPLALLLTVELISRVPVDRKGRARLRVAATAVIASIAAWVSYWHMVGVANRYGETDLTPYLLPISVDGLIVVASVSLVEVNARIRHHETTTVETVTPAPPPHNLAAPTTEPARPAVTTPADTANRLAATLSSATGNTTSAAGSNNHYPSPAGALAQEPLL